MEFSKFQRLRVRQDVVSEQMAVRNIKREALRSERWRVP